MASAGSTSCVAASIAPHPVCPDPHLGRTPQVRLPVRVAELGAAPLRTPKDKTMTVNTAANHLTGTTTRNREVLAEIVVARQIQLDSLPTTRLDEVSVAHRASVERILGEARAALRRIEDGTYGRCLSCGGAIPEGRLELRPWAATCARCV